LKIINTAKEKILSDKKSLSEIAYELGLNIRNTLQDYSSST
jgi:hypothetical protein